VIDAGTVLKSTGTVPAFFFQFLHHIFIDPRERNAILKRLTSSMDLRIMSNPPEATKLTALRARTDGQLIAFIDNRLDRGLRSDVAAAERIHREVTRLLPVVYGASQAERRRLEAKLARLSTALHHACASVA
jgi:hypothetical protein